MYNKIYYTQLPKQRLIQQLKSVKSEPLPKKAEEGDYHILVKESEPSVEELKELFEVYNTRHILIYVKKN